MHHLSFIFTSQCKKIVLKMCTAIIVVNRIAESNKPAAELERSRDTISCTASLYLVISVLIFADWFTGFHTGSARRPV